MSETGTAQLTKFVSGSANSFPRFAPAPSQPRSAAGSRGMPARWRRPDVLARALLMGDALTGCTVFVAGPAVMRYCQSGTAWPAGPGAGFAEWSMLAAAALPVAAFYGAGHYRRRLAPVIEGLHIFIASCAAFLIASLLTLNLTGHPAANAEQWLWAALLPALLIERTVIRAALQRSSAGVMHLQRGGVAPGAGRAGGMRLFHLQSVLKTGLDIVLALIALLLLSPLWLAIAALVKRDGGPVLYAQTRLGRDGRHFRCLKFRTMVVDADQRLQQLLSTDPDAAAEWNERHKLAQDPRITAIGAVLRSTSLDEIPQLLNVVMGDMSLVGPRPITDSEVSRYAEAFPFYCAVRPGITGLWQVSGRSETSYDHRVELDVRYVQTWSLLQDIVIVLKTIPAVLLRRGAV